MIKPTPIAERFEGKYIPVTESGCWLWIGAADQHGYGRIGGYDKHGKYRPLLATRVSLNIAGIETPDGLDACHKCDTPACVNPSHLFMGTRKENHGDMVRKGRAIQGGHYRNRAHCKSGHEFSGDNLVSRKHGRGCRECNRIKVAKYQARIKSTNAPEGTQP